MSSLQQLYSAIPSFIPLLGVLALTALGLWAADWMLLRRKAALGMERKFARQIAMLVLTAGGIVAAILTLPVSEGTRGQLLGLLGLVLTAVIALSSTTIVGNAMAGLMLRSVRSFRPGDFVRVGEQFGRVTEQGLFHTEIQTEDRDLTTLPNLYLVSQPITVVRSSGTIVSCSVSLGYETPHTTVTPLLVEAATRAELGDPFVQVTELGNFAIGYRVAGFLPEVKHLLSARSRLRTAVLDTLHGAGIEIVSPSFMNQRALAPGTSVIPAASTRPAAAEDEGEPENIIFDKAEHAERIEILNAKRKALGAELAEREAALAELEGEVRKRAERDVEALRKRVAVLDAQLEREKRATPR